MKPTVFISYSPQDADFAIRLKEGLETQDIAVTIDIESLKIGDNLQSFSEQSVRETDFTIPIVSQNGLKSVWFITEFLETLLYEKVEKKKKIVPISIDQAWHDDHFYLEVAKTIDEEINNLQKFTNQAIERKIGTALFDKKREKLQTIRNNLDKILERLYNTCVADFSNETEFHKNLLKLIEVLKPNAINSKELSNTTSNKQKRLITFFTLSLVILIFILGIVFLKWGFQNSLPWKPTATPSPVQPPTPTPIPEKSSNIVFILDASSSMNNKFDVSDEVFKEQLRKKGFFDCELNGGTIGSDYDANEKKYACKEGKEKIVKIHLAWEAIFQILKNPKFPENAHIGLYAFGHRKEFDCTDIEAIIPVISENKESFIQKFFNDSQIKQIKPKGKNSFGPITDTIERVAKDIYHLKEKPIIVLLSDGMQKDCSGNVVDKINEWKDMIDIDIVGLDATEEERAYMKNIKDVKRIKYVLPYKTNDFFTERENNDNKESKQLQATPTSPPSNSPSKPNNSENTTIFEFFFNDKNFSILFVTSFAIISVFFIVTVIYRKNRNFQPIKIFDTLIQKEISNIERKKPSSEIISQSENSSSEVTNDFQLYKNALLNRYKTFPIRFLEENQSLNLEDIYIPLKVRIPPHSEPIEIEDVLKKNRTFIVTGSPGAGKSMFCKHILLRYASPKCPEYSQVIPILIELYHLNIDERLDTETLERKFVEVLEAVKFPNAADIKNYLKDKRILLLLDGFDEVSSNKREEAVEEIKKLLLDSDNQCKMLITCRKEFNDSYLKTFQIDKMVEIAEFSDQQIFDFWYKWTIGLSIVQKSQAIQSLWKHLSQRPRLKGLIKTPFLLTILTFLHIEKQEKLPHSRVEFYKQIIGHLLKQSYHEKDLNRIDSRVKRKILQDIALNTQDSISNLSYSKGEVEESIYKVQSQRSEISYSIIKRCIKKVLEEEPEGKNLEERDILEEIVKRNRLLIDLDDGEYYQFSHQTLQEFLAAKELIRIGNEKSESVKFQELFERFSTYSDIWREVLKFCCGLVRDSSPIVRWLYKSYRDSMLTFECLVEIQAIKLELSDEVINDFITQLSIHNDRRKKIVQIFGAIASGDDESTQGDKTENPPESLLTYPQIARRSFDQLQKLFNDSEEGSSLFFGVAEALSYTYRSEVVNLLAQYVKYAEIRDDLIYIMGELSIKVFEDSAQQGDTTAMNALQAIGTPEATKILFRLIWEDNSTANHAAWRIVGLLKNIEANPPELTPEQQNSKEWLEWRWIWQPFKEKLQLPQDSPLPLIVGRIAHLIHTSSGNEIPESSLPFDKRICIPLYLSICDFNIPEYLKGVPYQEGIRFIEEYKEDVINLLTSEEEKYKRYLLNTLEPYYLWVVIDYISEPTRKNKLKKDWCNIFKKYDVV